MANPSGDAQLGILPSDRECKPLGLKREIRRRFPYRSYGKANISARLLALFGGRLIG
jgi:hypothetical protein